MNTIVVLGIDPGYALMGWGVVESEGSRMKLLGYGCVETKAGVPMQHRLRTLQLSIRDLVNIYQPELEESAVYGNESCIVRSPGKHGAIVSQCLVYRAWVVYPFALCR